MAAQGVTRLKWLTSTEADMPYLEQQQNFTVDGAASKVRIDAEWHRLTGVAWSAK